MIVDVKLVKMVVEAVKSGKVSAVGEEFLVNEGVDIENLPKYISMRLRGRQIFMDVPEADSIRASVGSDRK